MSFSMMHMQADVFDVASWRDQLQGAVGVISCLGAFGSNNFMQKICGDSNITVFNEAAKAGVSRAAFISVHDYKLPGKQSRLSRYCEQSDLARTCWRLGSNLQWSTSQCLTDNF